MKINDDSMLEGFSILDDDLKCTWCFIRLLRRNHKALHCRSVSNPWRPLIVHVADAVALWTLLGLCLTLSISKPGHFLQSWMKRLICYRKRGIEERDEIEVISSSEELSCAPACLLKPFIFWRWIITQLEMRTSRWRNEENNLRLWTAEPSDINRRSAQAVLFWWCVFASTINWS